MDTHRFCGMSNMPPALGYFARAAIGIAVVTFGHLAGVLVHKVRVGRVATLN